MSTLIMNPNSLSSCNAGWDAASHEQIQVRILSAIRQARDLIAPSILRVANGLHPGPTSASWA